MFPILLNTGFSCSFSLNTYHTDILGNDAARISPLVLTLSVNSGAHAAYYMEVALKMEEPVLMSCSDLGNRFSGNGHLVEVKRHIYKFC